MHLEIRQVPKLLARLACCEHEPHRLSQQPASDERERQRRGLIQPLRVVDDAEQGTLLSHLRDQAQDPQADEKPVRGRARAEPEHDLHGLTLWSRQPLEPIEQRCAQLMQARVGQLHLGLHPHRPDDGEIRRRLDQVLQQRRLPDPSLAPQNQRAALALPDRPDEPVQQGALASPALQARLPPRSGETIFHRPRAILTRLQRTEYLLHAGVQGLVRDNRVEVRVLFGCTPKSPARRGFSPFSGFSIGPGGEHLAATRQPASVAGIPPLRYLRCARVGARLDSVSAPGENWTTCAG